MRHRVGVAPEEGREGWCNPAHGSQPSYYYNYHYYYCYYYYYFYHYNNYYYNYYYYDYYYYKKSLQIT